MDEVVEVLEFRENKLLFLGVPMILTTRKFMATIQETMEEILGRRGAMALMERAAHKAAYEFALSQAKSFGLRGEKILRKYLSIASRRGWGRFDIKSIDLESGKCEVEIRNSYCEEFKRGTESKGYVWVGAIRGIMAYCLESMNKSMKLSGRETECIAKGDELCRVVVRPVDASTNEAKNQSFIE